MNQEARGHPETNHKRESLVREILTDELFREP